MDFVNKLTGSEKNKPVHTMDASNPQSSTGNSGGGMMDKLHGMVGGGTQSEKNEDGLDKGVDWVQENVLGQGPQHNESALEQAKDEQISDMIRGQYKKGTGKDIPVADK
ncbi:hypothetical protein B0T18DRAFT_344703 [Schizothecium vesticola]|uniref:Uncharacterized protein n=1 Tax=Schizothecium vesticola TaxID=314040 RepID=A0AA40K8J5_9PEZI|nr:hypothetical protein B0T18DRAFT_344703 [Schizothecium vesticola]